MLAEILHGTGSLCNTESALDDSALKKDRAKGQTHSENSSQLSINILLVLPSPLSLKHRQHTDNVSLQKSQPTTSASHIETQGATEAGLTVTFCSSSLRIC